MNFDSIDHLQFHTGIIINNIPMVLCLYLVHQSFQDSWRGGTVIYTFTLSEIHIESNLQFYEIFVRYLKLYSFSHDTSPLWQNRRMTVENIFPPTWGYCRPYSSMMAEYGSLLKNTVHFIENYNIKK